MFFVKVIFPHNVNGVVYIVVKEGNVAVPPYAVVLLASPYTHIVVYYQFSILKELLSTLSPKSHW